MHEIIYSVLNLNEECFEIPSLVFLVYTSIIWWPILLICLQILLSSALFSTTSTYIFHNYQARTQGGVEGGRTTPPLRENKTKRSAVVVLTRPVPRGGDKRGTGTPPSSPQHIKRSTFIANKKESFLL